MPSARNLIRRHGVSSVVSQTKRLRSDLTNYALSFFILSRWLDTIWRWCDLELEFKVSDGSLSELLYEALECLHEYVGKIVEGFRADLMEIWASLYPDSIQDAGAPLD